MKLTAYTITTLHLRVLVRYSSDPNIVADATALLRDVPDMHRRERCAVAWNQRITIQQVEDLESGNTLQEDQIHVAKTADGIWRVERGKLVRLARSAYRAMIYIDLCRLKARHERAL